MHKFFLGAVFFVYCAQVHAGAASVSCGATPIGRSFELPANGSDLRLEIATAPAWLEIVEAGQQVAVSGPASTSLAVPQPLRLGWHWLHLDAAGNVVVRRILPGHARAAIRATLHCGPAALPQQQLDWLQRANAIGSTLDKPAGAALLAATLATIDALAADASTAEQRAIALHYTAELLAANSRASEAASAFASAERAWTALRDRDRAQAARLGRIEALLSTDALQTVIEQTPDVATLHGAQSYFATRLENPRCLALQALGRLAPAADCFAWLLRNYRALGEHEDYFVAAQNAAGLQRDRGNLDAAEAIGRRSLQDVSGPDSTMLRGRLHLMLADLALRRGRVARAFADAQIALKEFDPAQFGVASWRARSLMFVAILYSQLGANDEALDSLAGAVNLLAPLANPSALAAAMNVYADIEANRHHAQSSLWWRRAAEATFEQLGMTAAAGATRDLRVDQQVQLGQPSISRSESSTLAPVDPLHAAQPLLHEAEVALRENRLDAARRAIDQARSASLTLRQQIRAALIQADYRERIGDHTGAQQTLRVQARHVDAIARRAGNPVLRYIIARQGAALRSGAFRLLLRSVRTNEPDPDAVWPWLIAPAAGGSSSDNSGQATAIEAFDRAAAAELLSAPGRRPAASGSESAHELLDVLAEGNRDTAGRVSATPRTSVRTLQAGLAPAVALAAYLDGDTRGALLWITHDDARIIEAAAPEDVRTSAAVLNERIRSAGTSILAIEDAARLMSDHLLAGLAGTSPPRRLYIVADEPANTIAWSALPWPGRNEPLTASTAVSFVHLAPTESVVARSAPAPVRLQVIAAAQTRATGSPLPELAAASVEAAQIRRVLGDAAARVVEHDHSTAAEMLERLRERGSWIHIAAHGASPAQRIGYSGLWLEPATGLAPALLSWLDVLDGGARADLVVLDACQLGDAGSRVSGNLSFADAVARAGARRVVAAAWPVSDAASALWVPVFYRTLLDDREGDVAQALRAAQLRLRASRAFRHPFFWAGLQTIEQLDPASHLIGAGATSSIAP